MLEIDERLKEPEGEMNLAENFNRIIAMLDEATEGLDDIAEQIADLDERVTALEGGDENNDDTPGDDTPGDENNDDTPGE